MPSSVCKNINRLHQTIPRNYEFTVNCLPNKKFLNKKIAHIGDLLYNYYENMIMGCKQ